MRKPLIICIVLAATGALTAGLALAATPPSRTVKVGDDYFVRPTGVPKITVDRNTWVRFKWANSTPHNVYGYRGSTNGTPKFNSETKLTKGAVYKKKMTTTGTFTIVCDIHRPDQTMKIKVVTP